MSENILHKKEKKILKKNHSSNTIISIKENLSNQSNFQTINPSSKSFQMSFDNENNNKKSQKEKSKQKTRNNSKSSKVPSSLINNMKNNESTLLKNIQLIDLDNFKLREALNEISQELEEKNLALNQSQKLLKKINFEYAQILNQFQNLEKEKNILKKDNERLKHLCNILNKNLINKEKNEKKNEQMKLELDKTKKLLNNIKGNYINMSGDFTKIEKDMKNKELIINDLKNEGNKISHMVQDREMLIKEYSKKISELNEIINQKDEQLKLMVNFSKELNSENKHNIKEITKQAVKTMNTFYNTRNNKNKENNNLIEIKNNVININDILSKKNCSFIISAIKNNLYIPENGNNFINREFLEENNIKTNLIKTELYSGILREFYLFNFINDWYNKFNESLTSIKIPKINNNTQSNSIKPFKKYYNELYNNLIKTKKENSFLKSKLSELKLYIKKLQNDFSNKNKKIKEKLEKIINQNKLRQNKEEISESKNDNKNEIKNPEQISKLNMEIDKVKNINHNLNEEILNKDEIINKLREENNKLINKLNLYRTNPNAENNFKFYKSYSTKENSIYQKNLFSKIGDDNIFNKTGTDLKLNTNKILNQNSFFESINENKSFDKNIHKYSTNKKEENKNTIKNLKIIKSEIINIDNSNKKNTKSKNDNKNYFTNLKIQYEDKIFFKSSNNLDNINDILSIIKDFISIINEEHFKEIVHIFFNSNQIIFMLNDKINDLKKNLSLIKEKFKLYNKEKKIKPAQFMDVLNEVEKLLFYLFNQLNKYNIDLKNILPFLKCIFSLLSIISYNDTLNFNEMNNNINNITPCNFDINNIMNISTSNNNNKYNSKKYIKDKILSNYNINQKTSEINNEYFSNLFFINTKIFSSSELIKYRSIYEGLELSEILPVFKEICSNFKKIILNSKFSYESEISDLEENIDLDMNKGNNILTENNTYHIVNEKIFGLKKFEFNFKLFFEVLKNYLVAFEIMVKYIEINMANIQYKKDLEKIVNSLYEVFEDSACLNLHCLDDNTIFCRKILLILLLNQKEYLSNFI